MSFDFKIFEGDIVIPTDSTEDEIAFVTDYQHALQALHLILLSPIGESRYHPGYGSSLSFLSYVTSEPQEIEEAIRSEVYRAISNLMALQKSQATRQLLTPEETILDIKSVDVFFDSVDPRLLNVVVTLILGNLVEAPASITVKIQ